MAVKNNRQFRKENKLFLRNHSGASVVEMLPLLVVFVILFGLTFGLWQSIHSGTLKSIAARHYAFEVINNRTHIIYHRDIGDKPHQRDSYYKKNGYRFFASVKRQMTTTNPDPIAEKKQINRFNSSDTQITNKGERTDYSTGQVNPVKLKIGYGICLDCKCGGTACN